MLDPGRFKQVLYNYLSNAVKFTPAGGSVQLRVTLVENEAFRVEVEDTGIGIPAVEISKLFQEFQQLPNSRRAEQGTGLGLALTRHIVEAQGGSVAVRSTPGRGSVFSAVLPLGAPKDGRENGVGVFDRERELEYGDTMAGEPILIVDDTPVNLKLTRILLVNEGYKCLPPPAPKRRWNCCAVIIPA